MSIFLQNSKNNNKQKIENKIKPPGFDKHGLHKISKSELFNLDNFKKQLVAKIKIKNFT